MEADRKRRALNLLAKLEQGAYNPESNVYSMAALVIAGALGEPYKNPREPDTEKAALAAMYAYSADVHALADYVKELEQQAAAADASPFLNGIDYEPPELELTEPEIELADFEFNPEFEPVEEEPARAKVWRSTHDIYTKGTSKNE